MSTAPEQPFLLIQHGCEDRTADLEVRWSAGRTFAFVGRRTGLEAGWLDGVEDRLPEEYATDHFCLLTSGTTGGAKLVVASKARAERMCAVLHREQELDPVQEAIVALPLTYCFALVNQWLWARTAGRRLKVTPGLMDPERLGRALAGAADAMLCLVGSQVPLMLGLFGGRQFAGVIRLNFAGGRFPQERLTEIKRLFPEASIFNNYGCTEAMPRLALRRSEQSSDALDIGLPIPGVELRAGDGGVLEFRSPYRAVAEVDPGGFRPIGDEEWLRTGDLAERAGGNAWRLLGRSGEVFKRFGEKVAIPRVLATAGREWAGQMATYRERDSRGEEGYVLVCSPEPESESLQRLLQALRGGHPRAHWPLRIESVDSLPWSANGKVSDTALAAIEEKKLHWRQRI